MMNQSSRRVLVASTALALTQCTPVDPPKPILTPIPGPTMTGALAPALPAEPVPLGRLPSDVRPQHVSLTLHIDPNQDRFSGTVEILVNLTQPRDVIWLHGKDMHAKSATVKVEGSTPVIATYTEVDPSGVVALRLPQPIGPGRTTIHIDFDAPFMRTAEGLYVVERAGKRYAFTQFEPVSARRAFPCFDEPAFKVPFDVTLIVPKGMEAIANTREIERTDAAEIDMRVTYATTAPMPSYLAAFAVGPFDVVVPPPIPPNAVRKRALPFRGVAAQGRGKELAHSLAETAEMVHVLESYFGIEYPYDKLDIVAVPDKIGGMENVATVMMAEQYLLVDDTTPTDQKRFIWTVMLHEVAHQWFGDLVTMPWWDDTWLKEAFATWSSGRLVPTVRPENGADVWLLHWIHDGMRADSLVSARQVRQDVRNGDDIVNAFDFDITYSKGASVIGMFERWMGKEAFRTGISSYLKTHGHGGAVMADLFAALSTASARDVATPFRSFLDQPGVPLVDAKIVCSAQGNVLELQQKRHLPLGSTGDPNRVWQIPICAKMPGEKATTEVCTLLTKPKASLPLPGSTCPAWVMPNAGAVGYYIFSMPVGDMNKLTTTAYKDLNLPERVAVVHSLQTSFGRGTPIADILPVLVPLANLPERQMVHAAMEPFRIARSWLTRPVERDALEKEARQVLGPVWKSLGWAPNKGKVEDDDRRELRADVLSFMVGVARDKAIRKEAAEKGRAYVGYGKDGAFHMDVADKDLLGTCLVVAAEEGNAAFFDHLVRSLERAGDETTRKRVIVALGSFRTPDLAARALALSFDPRIPSPEVVTIVDAQLREPDTRDNAWLWFKHHIDDIAAKSRSFDRRQLPLQGASFCDNTHADELQALFAERMQKIEGASVFLAKTVEAIRLCTASRAIQEPSFRKALEVPAPKVP